MSSQTSGSTPRSSPGSAHLLKGLRPQPSLLPRGQKLQIVMRMHIIPYFLLLVYIHLNSFNLLTADCQSHNCESSFTSYKFIHQTHEIEDCEQRYPHELLSLQFKTSIAISRVTNSHHLYRDLIPHSFHLWMRPVKPCRSFFVWDPHLAVTGAPRVNQELSGYTSLSHRGCGTRVTQKMGHQRGADDLEK